MARLLVSTSRRGLPRIARRNSRASDFGAPQISKRTVWRRAEECGGEDRARERESEREREKEARIERERERERVRERERETQRVRERERESQRVRERERERERIRERNRERERGTTPGGGRAEPGPE